MPELIEALGIDRMAGTERRKLFHELRMKYPEEIEDVPGTGEFTDEWKMELDRRVTELKANPDIAIPWEDVEREILEELDR